MGGGSVQNYKTVHGTNTDPTPRLGKHLNQARPHDLTTHLAHHVTSVSFPSQKGVEDYNQPFVENNTIFVFNGLLQGVSFPTPIPGADRFPKDLEPREKTSTGKERSPKPWKKTVQVLQAHTKHIQAKHRNL